MLIGNVIFLTAAKILISTFSACPSLSFSLALLVHWTLQSTAVRCGFLNILCNPLLAEEELFKAATDF